MVAADGAARRNGERPWPSSFRTGLLARPGAAPRWRWPLRHWRSRARLWRRIRMAAAVAAGIAAARPQATSTPAAASSGANARRGRTRAAVTRAAAPGARHSSAWPRPSRHRSRRHKCRKPRRCAGRAMAQAGRAAAPARPRPWQPRPPTGAATTRTAAIVAAGGTANAVAAMPAPGSPAVRIAPLHSLLPPRTAAGTATGGHETHALERRADQRGDRP